METTTEIMNSQVIDYSWLFIKVCIALVIVIGLAVIFIKLIFPRLKGFHRASQSVIQIVDRNAVEPRKNLYLIQVGERYFLVGTTDHAMSLIGEFNKDEINKAYS